MNGHSVEETMEVWRRNGGLKKKMKRGGGAASEVKPSEQLDIVLDCPSEVREYFWVVSV